MPMYLDTAESRWRRQPPHTTASPSSALPTADPPAQVVGAATVPVKSIPMSGPTTFPPAASIGLTRPNTCCGVLPSVETPATAITSALPSGYLVDRGLPRHLRTRSGDSSGGDRLISPRFVSPSTLSS